MRVRTMYDAGLLVRNTRTEQGLTQQELAEKAGVSKRWIVSFEAGKANANLRLFLDVLEILDIDLTAGGD